MQIHEDSTQKLPETQSRGKFLLTLASLSIVGAYVFRRRAAPYSQAEIYNYVSTLAVEEQQKLVVAIANRIQPRRDGESVRMRNEDCAVLAGAFGVDPSSEKQLALEVGVQIHGETRQIILSKVEGGERCCLGRCDYVPAQGNQVTNWHDSKFYKEYYDAREEMFSSVRRIITKHRQAFLDFEKQDRAAQARISEELGEALGIARHISGNFEMFFHEVAINDGPTKAFVEERLLDHGPDTPAVALTFIFDKQPVLQIILSSAFRNGYFLLDRRDENQLMEDNKRRERAQKGNLA